MSGSYCIKKNEDSVLNPWLSRMSARMGLGNGLVYASLDDLIKGNCILETFPTIEAARSFIEGNPECDDRNVICQVTAASPGKHPEMEPIE